MAPLVLEHLSYDYYNISISLRISQMYFLNCEVSTSHYFTFQACYLQTSLQITTSTSVIIFSSETAVIRYVSFSVIRYTLSSGITYHQASDMFHFHFLSLGIRYHQVSCIIRSHVSGVIRYNCQWSNDQNHTQLIFVTHA